MARIVLPLLIVIATAGAAGAAPTRDPQALVTRNIFCSSCTYVPPAPDGGKPAAPVHVKPRLIATLSAIGGGWATVIDADGLGGAYAAGATLPGGGVLVAVRAGAIDVRFPDGVVERIALADDAATVAGKPAPQPSPAAADDPWADRVRKLGDDQYQIDRALIAELVSTGAGARVKGVRIAPYEVDGKLAGIRVAAAAKGSVAAALGLAPGDVIASVNGSALDSTDALMRMYRDLDRIQHVELGITRGGARRTLAYDLQ